MISSVTIGRDYWTIPYLVVLPKNCGKEEPWLCKVVGRTPKGKPVGCLYNEADGTGGLNAAFCFVLSEKYLWKCAKQAVAGYHALVIGNVESERAEKSNDDWLLLDISEYAAAIEHDCELRPFDDNDDEDGDELWQEEQTSGLYFSKEEENGLFLQEHVSEHFSQREAERRDRNRRAERDAAKTEERLDGRPMLGAGSAVAECDTCPEVQEEEQK